MTVNSNSITLASHPHRFTNIPLTPPISFFFCSNILWMRNTSWWYFVHFLLTLHIFLPFCFILTESPSKSQKRDSHYFRWKERNTNAIKNAKTNRFVLFTIADKHEWAWTSITDWNLMTEKNCEFVVACHVTQTSINCQINANWITCFLCVCLNFSVKPVVYFQIAFIIDFHLRKMSASC